MHFRNRSQESVDHRFTVSGMRCKAEKALERCPIDRQNSTSGGIFLDIATAATTDLAPEAVFSLYASLIAELNQPPDFVVVSCSKEYDIAAIIAGLRKHTPQVALHGGTSCKGVMTQMGLAAGDNGGLAMLAISDPEGSYGVGAARHQSSTDQCGLPRRGPKYGLAFCCPRSRRGGA